ncbi:hypothetical protein PAXRUDRAFT_487103 [Paxillus rubicundulus Ve08.2h10]|uniref:Uncharacterized protein n=1 Tax=Paxillus rubicundulus Ve08.2h10 TaxID=930991 RepID=A0A0D0DPH8_9AGAM|nr:hypothetical protein PAXRUDRAFT_487103 [Paxillus rubicundulus Ve08.2h10]
MPLVIPSGTSLPALQPRLSSILWGSESRNGTMDMSESSRFARLLYPHAPTASCGSLLGGIRVNIASPYRERPGIRIHYYVNTTCRKTRSIYRLSLRFR